MDTWPAPRRGTFVDEFLNIISLAGIGAAVTLIHWLLYRAYLRIASPTDEVRTKAMHRMGWATLAGMLASIALLVFNSGSWYDVLAMIGVLIVIELSQTSRRARMMNLPLTWAEMIKRSLRANFFMLLMYALYIGIIILPQSIEFDSPLLRLAALLLGIVAGLFSLKLFSPILFSLAHNTVRLEDPEIVGPIQARLREAGLPELRVDVIPLKSYKVANAFVVGLARAPGPFRGRIGISDSLIQDFTKPEIDAIVAHEISHFRQNHIARRMWIPLIAFALLFVGLIFAMRFHPWPNLALVTIPPEITVYFYSFLGIVLWFTNFFYITRRLVRSQELDADWLALHHFRLDPDLYFSTLDKLTRYSGESTKKRNPMNFMSPAAAHPTTEERRDLVTRHPPTTKPPFERAAMWSLGRLLGGVFVIFICFSLFLG